MSGAVLSFPAAGQAATATYPGGNGNTFTGSAEGWSGSSSCDLGAGLLCETSAGYDPGAGAPAGSLAVRTQVALNAAALFHVTATEESPDFTVGEGGSGTVALERQFEPGGLLALSPRASYQVVLLDHTDGTRQEAIEETIEEASAFTPETGTVGLVSGHTYSVLISAGVDSTVAGLGVTGADELRFDDVSVTGPGEGSTGGSVGGSGSRNGPGGGAGSGGGSEGGGSKGTGTGNDGSGGNGADGLSSAKLESLLQSGGLIGPATMKGGRISVRAKCPAKVKGACTLSLRGMLSRHVIATAGRRAKVKKGRKKTIALSVRPAARSKVQTKKKLLFKETVRVGKAKATVWRTLRLVRR